MHQQHWTRYLAHCTLDLRVTRVADQEYHATLRCITLALTVDLCDERAGGIHDAEATRLRLVLHQPRDAVRTENGHGSGRHFRERLDETRPLGAETLDYMAVVDDFVADVYRRTKPRECLFNNIDSPDHARTETARLGEDHAHDHDLPCARNKTKECVIC